MAELLEELYLKLDILEQEVVCMGRDEYEECCEEIKQILGDIARLEGELESAS